MHWPSASAEFMHWPSVEFMHWPSAEFMYWPSASAEFMHWPSASAEFMHWPVLSLYLYLLLLFRLPTRNGRSFLEQSGSANMKMVMR